MVDENPSVKNTAAPAPRPDGELKKVILPRIRTYAADMSTAIRERGETLSSIVEAQQAAKDRVEAPPPKNNTLKLRLIVGGGIALIFLGIGLISLVIYLVQKNDDPTYLLPESIIFPNSTVTIGMSATESLGSQLSYEREGKNLSLGEIERIVVTENGAPISAQKLAEELGLPSAVTREVEDIMMGIHSFDRNQPFVILTVSAYDRSFNGMLDWEKNAGRDLGSFFAPRNAPTPVPNLVFEDVIVRNIDVRKSQSTWPLLYAYPSRNILVITTNEFTLREITSRLGNARPQ